MKRVFVIGSLLLYLFVVGCASQSGWTPTVDTYNDPNLARLNQDMVECKALAQRVSGYTPREVGEGALIGVAIGAATGAAVGAVFGSAGKGAAAGAAAMGIGGGAYKGLEAEAKYKRAYSDCMRNRGHKVLD